MTRGINLLPPDYKRQKKAQNIEKLIIIAIGIALLISCAMMLWPLGVLKREKEELRGLTYRLQGSEFDELKKLQEEKKVLVEAVETKKQLIQSLGMDKLGILQVLYNLVDWPLSDSGLERVSMSTEDGAVLLEGRALNYEEIIDRMQAIQKSYPDRKIDLQTEDLGERGGVYFQITVNLGEDT